MVVIVSLSTFSDFIYSNSYASQRSHHISIANSASGYFTVLPAEIIVHILSFLPYRSVNAVALCNHFFHHLSADDNLWRIQYRKMWRPNTSTPLISEPLLKRPRRSWKPQFIARHKTDKVLSHYIYHNTYIQRERQEREREREIPLVVLFL